MLLRRLTEADLALLRRCLSSIMSTGTLVKWECLKISRLRSDNQALSAARSHQSLVAPSKEEIKVSGHQRVSSTSKVRLRQRLTIWASKSATQRCALSSIWCLWRERLNWLKSKLTSLTITGSSAFKNFGEDCIATEITKSFASKTRSRGTRRRSTSSQETTFSSSMLIITSRWSCSISHPRLARSSERSSTHRMSNRSISCRVGSVMS